MVDVQAHTNLTEIDQALDLLWRNNIDPLKATLGLGFYGRSFTLADPSCTAPGCKFLYGGNPGPCTATSGILSYEEIMSIINGSSNVARDESSTAADVTVVHDVEATVQIASWGNQWVSFDDATTFKQKTDYANSHGLGGMSSFPIPSNIRYGLQAVSFQQHRLMYMQVRWHGQWIWTRRGRLPLPCPPALHNWP